MIKITKSGSYYAGSYGADKEVPTPHFDFPKNLWVLAVRTPDGYMPVFS